jgi:hypothetical protein
MFRPYNSHHPTVKEIIKIVDQQLKNAERDLKICNDFTQKRLTLTEVYET